MTKIEQLIDIFNHPMISTVTEFRDGGRIGGDANYTLSDSEINEVLKVLQIQLAIENGEAHVMWWKDLHGDLINDDNFMIGWSKEYGVNYYRKLENGDKVATFNSNHNTVIPKPPKASAEQKEDK